MAARFNDSRGFWKQPVKVVATANLASAGAQTIDGVACVVGDDVLLTAQAAGADNGIVTIGPAAFHRRMDCRLSEHFHAGMLIPVQSGTAGAGKVYQLDTAGAIVPDTTALVFSESAITSVAGGLVDIADPGDGLAIPVTASGSCAIVTAGAETRTLAIPVIRCQRIQLYCDTYVGDCVITVASAVDTIPGSTIITMEQAGDWIELVGMTVGGTLAWRVAGNSGCALT